MEQIAWDAYNQKRQFDLSSNDPQYDAFLANDGQFDWAFGPAGQLADPNEFINDPKLTDKTWYDLQDVSPKLVAAASWDGVPGHYPKKYPLFNSEAAAEAFIRRRKIVARVQRYTVNPDDGSLGLTAGAGEIIDARTGDEYGKGLLYPHPPGRRRRPSRRH